MEKYKFKILNPKDTEHWAEVRIYKTLRAYRKARGRMITINKSRIKNKDQAKKIPTSAMTWIATKPRDDGRVAEIYFNMEHWWAGIIAHELSHLAIWYWKMIMKRKLSDINRRKYEEEFADLQGWIMNNFNDEVLSKVK